MNTLIVITARMHNSGITRKCMRLMHGKPLLEYTIDIALGCTFSDDICIVTDSAEVRDFARQFPGLTVCPLSVELADKSVTLDPVVYGALDYMESLTSSNYDCVITLQSNSPLLSVDTLKKAYNRFCRNDIDTIVSVVNEPKLSWRIDESGSVVPAYMERRNRGQLPPNYIETGSFLLSRRSCMTRCSRFGSSVAVFEIPETEAVWIDSKEDWVACESILARKLIVFRVDGYSELGLGHVFRALTLSYEFINDDVVFVCKTCHREGIERLRSSCVDVVEIDDDPEFFQWLDRVHPDILVNDTLDTTSSYISELKARVPRIVTFEDLGTGAREADAVVNAIYEGASSHSNTFTGKSYVCLRDEFLLSKPAHFNEEVKRILVTFGGTDPLDLTGRLYDIVLNNKFFSGLRFDFILGPGYVRSDIVPVPTRGIFVSRGVSRISDYMRNADIALSSQGRTTFELASMGVPTITMSQNKREQLHTFAQMDNGFINLGLGSEVSDEDIASTLLWLISAKSVRREMHKLMLDNDLRSGIRRVKKIILGEQL